MPSSAPTAASCWRELIRNLKTWRRGTEVAPHKPLLLLWLLGRASRGEAAAVPYSDVAEPLAHLLQEFGPPRDTVHPEYPFHRLQSDGIWLVTDMAGQRVWSPRNDPSPKRLIGMGAVGEVPALLWAAVRKDTLLRAEIAHALLDAFWPETYHWSILQEVGLDPCTDVTRAGAKRDPRFREAVLRAYERRCAVCGYDARLRDGSFGLEAAHVRWHCYGGPSSVDNGVALCDLHHTALDRGAIGLDGEHRIQVSAELVGGEAVTGSLLAFAGRVLRRPQAGCAPVRGAYIAWHRETVFREPARRMTS